MGKRRCQGRVEQCCQKVARGNHLNQRVFKPSLFDCGSFRSLSSVESTVNNGRDKAGFISEGHEAMQMVKSPVNVGFR